MVTPSPKPRYDRIVSLVLLVLLGLAVVFLIDRNPDILRARLGGDLPVITLSWALVISLVVITATGADVFIRSHPQMQTRRLPAINLGFVRFELAPGFWILPSFAIAVRLSSIPFWSNSVTSTPRSAKAKATQHP